MAHPDLVVNPVITVNTATLVVPVLQVPLAPQEKTLPSVTVLWPTVMLAKMANQVYQEQREESVCQVDLVHLVHVV